MTLGSIFVLIVGFHFLNLFEHYKTREAIKKLASGEPQGETKS